MTVTALAKRHHVMVKTASLIAVKLARGYVAHPLGMRLLGAFMVASGALLIYIIIARR